MPILIRVFLLFALSYAYSKPNSKSLSLSASYWKYLNHWTDSPTLPLQWVSKDSLSRSSRPAQTLQILALNSEYKLLNHYLLGLKTAYHWNTVEAYKLFGAQQQARNHKGIEDLELALGYQHNNLKIRTHLLSPLLQDTKGVGDGYAEAWAGFGVWRLGGSLEHYVWQQWFQLMAHRVVFTPEQGRVEVGDYEFKFLHYYGVNMTGDFDYHLGYIISFQSYHWIPNFTGQGLWQRDFQVEPHLGVAYNIYNSKFKIDLGLTAYSNAYSNYELEDYGEFTDATRQLVLGIIWEAHY